MKWQWVLLATIITPFNYAQDEDPPETPTLGAVEWWYEDEPTSDGALASPIRPAQVVERMLRERLTLKPTSCWACNIPPLRQVPAQQPTLLPHIVCSDQDSSLFVIKSEGGVLYAVHPTTKLGVRLQDMPEHVDAEWLLKRAFQVSCLAMGVCSYLFDDGVAAPITLSLLFGSAYAYLERQAARLPLYLSGDTSIIKPTGLWGSLRWVIPQVEESA